MKPEDLTGKIISISKNSITVKDENDKTRGVVRNISCMKDMQANKLFDASNKLRKMGIDRAEVMNIIKFLFPYENEFYFFADNHFIKEERELFKKHLFRNQDYKLGVESLAARGIKVVYCERIYDTRRAEA